MAKTAYNEWCDRGIHLANHTISITRILFNHGVREELCQTNPFAMVRKRAAERRKVVWGRDDVQKFLEVAYEDFSTRNIGLIAQMAYECGIQEICNALPNQLNSGLIISDCQSHVDSNRNHRCKSRNYCLLSCLVYNKSQQGEDIKEMR